MPGDRCASCPGHARDAEGIIRRAWTASMDAVAAPGGCFFDDSDQLTGGVKRSVFHNGSRDLS